MSNEVFVKLIIGIITIIGTLISAYLIPYLEAKLEQTKMADLLSFVEKCVKWANQTIPQEEWERKKIEVMQKVEEYIKKHTGIELTDSDLDAIVEAVVYSVKNRD